MNPLTAAAAANNAHWCDVVSRCHGVTTRFAPDAWTAAARTPPYYPDAVTLTPTVDPSALLARVDAGPGCSVKDSFATLDLAPAGFAVLFDATWIVHDPYDRAGPGGWHRVTTPAGLAAWTDAHGDAPFPPALLEDPAVTVLALTGPDPTAAPRGGVVAYRGAGVVSLSNLFGPPDHADEVWAGAGAAVSACAPGLPVVGYERGPELTAAHAAGFTALDPLRVWYRPTG